jgi:membrane-associated protease RseP (regulator of RpoE activity)
MWSSEDFDEGKRTAAIEAFHVDGRLQVYAVAAGQPAEAAGIRPGDILTHIDGQPLQEGAAGRAQYAEAVTTGLMKRGVVSFEFLTGQEKKRARLRAVKACPYAIAMAVGSEPNAATDGATVYVSSGMLKFVVSDAELAIVLGHELAHAIRQHPLKNRGEQTGRSLAKAVMGDVYDATVGIGSAVWSIVAGVPEERRNSISFEMVADELGLYLAARSGYDVSVAPHFWTRLISSYNEASSDHPTSADRFQATAEEIAAKRAQGEKLSPPLDPGS